MRLADEAVIALGGEILCLRPTLRAALRLERKHGSFEPIIKALMDGSLTMIADVIFESTHGAQNVMGVLAALGMEPIGAALDSLTEPLLKHVFALMGFDCDATPEPTSGERLTFAAYHARLFQIGTGHLGWTPEATWNATPVEIIEASKGRNNFISDLLMSIFGGKRPQQSASPDGDVLDRDGLNVLRFD